ncbi:hypothetical protein [Ferrimonas pelagia]
MAVIVLAFDQYRVVVGIDGDDGGDPVVALDHHAGFDLRDLHNASPLLL